MLLFLFGFLVLYYDDEIGMGDDFWLFDCDGVCILMQWDDLEMVGFFIVFLEDFYLFFICIFGYDLEYVNVVCQMDDLFFLLVWMCVMFGICCYYFVFGIGEFIDLGGLDMVVMFFLCYNEYEMVLCLVNFFDIEWMVVFYFL